MDEATTPPVPNHLRFAILTSVVCFMPLGLIAIVYAAQVAGKLEAGDVAGAIAASARAKRWAWLAFWLGIVSYILFALLLGGLWFFLLDYYTNLEVNP